jgi:molybdate transport system ATP-binding protein
MVMQESALFPTMTAGQNIEIARQIPESEVQQLIEKTGISSLLDKPAAVLSGGEARRVALVRAFAAKPQLLILDEPTSGLDPRKRLEILRLSRQIACSRNVQILLITHNLEEMLAAADHAILMHEGEILAAGDVAEVLSHPKTADLLAIDDAGSLIAAKITGREAGLLKAEFGNQSLYLQDDGEPEGASVRLRILARDVALSTGPLEGVSILNQISGTVETLCSGAGTASVTVSVGGQQLVSRITEKSCKDMNLEEGQPITCLVKAVAVKELMQE